MTGDMQARLEVLSRVLQDIQTDLQNDAMCLDITKFTSAGTGETFGIVMGVLSGLAGCVEVLVAEVSRLARMAAEQEGRAA